MNFSQGHSGTKVQCESCVFSQRKTPEFTKMGEIHELFVLVLSLVWFAGVTPQKRARERLVSINLFGHARPVRGRSLEGVLKRHPEIGDRPKKVPS